MDSYKKIRYADFVYMCRMNPSLNFLSDQVRRHVLGNNDYTDNQGLTPQLAKIKDELVDKFIVFEMKITKSKESEKDKLRYALFCKENVKIYNTVQEYLDDCELMKKNTEYLKRELSSLTMDSFSDVTDIFSDFNISDELTPDRY